MPWLPIIGGAPKEGWYGPTSIPFICPTLKATSSNERKPKEGTVNATE